MIRLILGFLIVYGAVGSMDYAMQVNEPEPHWVQTGILLGLGFTLMYYGVERVREKYGEED